MQRFQVMFALQRTCCIYVEDFQGVVYANAVSVLEDV